MADREPAKMEMRDTTPKPVVVGRMNPGAARTHGLALNAAWDAAADATEALSGSVPDGFRILESWVEEFEDHFESGVSAEQVDD